MSYHSLRSLLSGLVASALLSLGLPALAADDDGRTSSITRIHPANFGIDQAELDTIRRQMQAAVDGGFLPGALLLVGNRDGVGVLETVGYRAPDSRDPVNKDTIFRIYSMTKPIISVAIMTMVEDGMIDLDDPLEDLSLIHI